MPDSRLRELERSAAGGDDDARAQLLRERVRGGALAADRLRLAAYLGDPAALKACAQASASASDLVAWGRGLQQWGDEPCIRAAAVAADLGLRQWESWEPGEIEPGLRLRAALDAALAHWRQPSDALFDEAARLFTAASTAIDGASRHLAALEAEHGLSLDEAWRAHSAGLAALFVSESILFSYLDRRADLLDLPSHDIGLALKEVSSALGSSAQVAAAIRAALIPWALAPIDSVG